MNNITNVSEVHSWIKHSLNIMIFSYRNSQKAKLRSILYYFDKLEADGEPQGRVTYSRQVMTSKEWLTIEDWLENSQSLCPLAIRHEGKLERAESNMLQVCFTSSRLGGYVLYDGSSQVGRI
jgi:hypothetical protein